MGMLRRDWPHLRIEQPGFIEHATDPRVGISPDGLALDSVTGDVYLIEIKCPFVRGIGDGIKDEYKSQVQLSMSVLRSHGVDSRCLFMQYNPHPSEQATYDIFLFFGRFFSPYQGRKSGNRPASASGHRRWRRSSVWQRGRWGRSR
jgi:hypothetical protein